MTIGGDSDSMKRRGSPQPPIIAADRLAFVDVMRTIAVGRVVVNHALPWHWMKWFESLPVMFFVSGTLVGRSLQNRGWRNVLGGRFRRLALPTGVYLAFAFAMSSPRIVNRLVGNGSAQAVVLGITVANHNILNGTMVHLWYIWNFLAFTALSPIFLWCIRKSIWLTLTVMCALVVLWTLLDVPGTANGTAYALSWVAGMVWAERDCMVPSRRFLYSTLVAGSIVAVVSVWWLLGIDLATSPSKSGISMAALGVAWLSVGMLMRRQLEGLMHVRGLGPFIRYLNRRLLTIYLWHLPATVLGRMWSADLGLDGFASVVFVLTVTFAGTGVATVAFGGLEDRASASSKRLKAAAVAT